MAKEHVHLIGIGGTGMTALAGLLQQDGCRVTGSDQQLYPPTSTILDGLGLEPGTGFDAARLRPAPDLVVVGNAISRGNPEVEEMLDRSLRYTSMPRLISERFLRGRHSIVVSGTHGKTTTASMLAWVLYNAGRDPGFLIGGAPLNFDLPFRIGSGPAFVIEGDEYDTAFFDKGPKFMHYCPTTALIGTIEFDHADIYGDEQQIETAFRRLVNLVPRRGLIVRHEESPITLRVTDNAFSRVEGYGFAAGSWTAEGFEESEDGASFRVRRDGEPFVDVQLAASGRHNARNAMAVIAAAAEQGLSPDEIGRGLASFKGVRRRLELRGQADGVRVFDDFAHHPTAIEETLRAVRRRQTQGRVWAVLEPRSWSLRRNVFQQRLAESFDAADRTIIADVYAADAIEDERRLDVERLVQDLRSRGNDAAHISGTESIVRRLAEGATTGDVVVIMSNGAFEGLHQRVLDALGARARAGAGVAPRPTRT